MFKMFTQKDTFLVYATDTIFGQHPLGSYTILQEKCAAIFNWQCVILMLGYSCFGKLILQSANNINF